MRTFKELFEDEIDEKQTPAQIMQNRRKMSRRMKILAKKSSTKMKKKRATKTAKKRVKMMRKTAKRRVKTRMRKMMKRVVWICLRILEK